MKCKNVLITGGAGFIGSNFIFHFMERNPKVNVYNLDVLTYAGNLNNLKGLNTSKYTFVEGNICDGELVSQIFKDHCIDGVIHFAAESHVDNSINSPKEFIKTNIEGTFSLLDVARNAWMQAPFIVKPEFEHARFHHISTDEVYGTLGPKGYFTEETPYAPNSPYSASKASSDMIVRSYFHTYGLNTVITNCSNNYGPRQHNEKLIPVIIRNAISQKSIPIYGDGKNIRDWLFVDDHCGAICEVFAKGVRGEVYNVGGDCEKTNLEVVDTILGKLDEIKPLAGEKSYKDLINFVKDRPGHDRRYAIDATKMKEKLGWTPSMTFEEGIDKTIKWYLD
jgi:dTDP-glucose 4,6-dehydratase